nr:integrase, catalytic region, zinc finger, CCHC-type, peptidase aspartic, catalytic [Tanacetum cinerariifolium]
MMAPKVPTYNGRPTFANPRYLKHAQCEIPCLYAFPYDQNTHANRLIPDEEETIALERESRSKMNKDLIKHSKDQFRTPTAHDMEILIQTCLMPLAIKTQNVSLKFVHELKQEMHADLMYVESLEKEIDELESDKAELSDMYDVKECDCLAQKLSKQTESFSKKVHTELLQRFAIVEKHSISLELALQKCKEQVKNDTVCNEKASNVFRKEHEQYFKIQDLKAQLQDKNIAITKLKKLIEKGKAKSVDTKFDSPSVTMSVLKTNVSEGLSKPVTAQTLPQASKKAVSNTNVLKPRRMTNVLKRTNSLGSNLSTIPSSSNSLAGVQLILFIVDSGCTKHMMGNLNLLCNFVEKFLGTVRFGNDQFAPILSYGDLVQGNVTINRVYYVEGLNHNLFSVGQFYDADLEVAFRKSTCFVRDL